jgi:ATP-dependent RNA helicase DDX42
VCGGGGGSIIAIIILVGDTMCKCFYLWLYIYHVLGGALHGDLQQFEREKVLRDFKSNTIRILVATDVAARGLDIKSVKTVVNYDIAHDIDSHTHRVGRTGRAGEKGTAHTLITQKEDRFAGQLVRHLESTSGQVVPPELLTLAMKNHRFRDDRNRRGRGGRGRGRYKNSRGEGSFGSDANAEPLLQSKGMINFQKSSTGGLNTVQRKSRWQ